MTWLGTCKIRVGRAGRGRPVVLRIPPLLIVPLLVAPAVAAGPLILIPLIWLLASRRGRAFARALPKLVEVLFATGGLVIECDRAAPNRQLAQEQERFTMSDERQRILKMLAEGKITVDEAERLLDAVGAAGAEAPAAAPGAPHGQTARKKFLRVQVQETGGDRVNIRVPLNLLRAGMKLRSLIPQQASEKIDKALHDKGINVDIGSLKGGALDEMIDQLGELTVEVNEPGGDQVRIFCE